jgi:hypothetical protein
MEAVRTVRRLSSVARHRRPLIKFRYGKRFAETAPQSHPTVPAPSGRSPGDYLAAQASLFPSKAEKSYLSLPAMFGRPKLTEAEIRAISSGGAY